MSFRVSGYVRLVKKGWGLELSIPIKVLDTIVYGTLTGRISSLKGLWDLCTSFFRVPSKVVEEGAWLNDFFAWMSRQTRIPMGK